jgi:hypothetical protein
LFDLFHFAAGTSYILSTSWMLDIITDPLFGRLCFYYAMIIVYHF